MILIFGMCNNFAYSVMLGAAQDILKKSGENNMTESNTTDNCIEEITSRSCSPTSVGVVLLCNILPCLLVKTTCPFFMHRISYGVRHFIICLTQMLSLLITAFADSIPVALCGVLLASFSSGFGETTYLALASHYSNYFQVINKVINIKLRCSLILMSKGKNITPNQRVMIKVLLEQNLNPVQISKFNRFESDGKKYVRCRPGEECMPKCAILSITHGRDSMRVWAAFNRNEPGPLHIVEGIMDKVKGWVEIGYSNRITIQNSQVTPRNVGSSEEKSQNGVAVAESRLESHRTPMERCREGDTEAKAIQY
uniref:Battenin n=1 Tax=Heterorhabditis bacteriophora TaxID=37862 RepID=A0A1I7WJ38_HETBA